MVTAALANSAWWMASAPAWAAFEVALEDPGLAQEQILRNLIRRNANTAFGREHGFSDIRSPEQFARRVPPRDYDDFEPWIARIRQGEANVLTSEPVRRLVPSSGSTAARKLIPYTASMQREFNRAIAPWIFDLYRQHPGVSLGPAYWSVTPVSEDATADQTTSKVPIGFDDDTDYLGGWRSKVIAAVMAVPATVRSIPSIDHWRYVTLLSLLRRADLSLISVWHPSFLDLLMKSLALNWEHLLCDVSMGTCTVAAQLAPQIAPASQAKPLASRARELTSLSPENGSKIWPSLRVISCWADANAAGAAAKLKRTFPGVLLQPKGLLATEGVISIPFRGKHPLAIRSHYLEFEDEEGRSHLAADLQVSKTYKVLLTTAGGLYRYRLHDLVKVDGTVGRTPSIRFSGKTHLISDRMGEKLTDSFVAGALASLFRNEGDQPAFAMLAPDIDEEGCRYTLYVEADVPPSSEALDSLLLENPQYAYCRKLSQLRPPRVFRIAADSYALYAERLCLRGQRLGDIKPVALSPLDGWSTIFQGVYADR